MHKGLPWNDHGASMGLFWNFYGVVVSPRRSMGLPCGFDGTSVGHPWGSHETSDGLSWPFERSTINSHSMGRRWKWNTPFLRYFDGMPIGHPKALMEFTRTTYSSAIGFGTSVGLPWCSHGAPIGRPLGFYETSVGPDRGIFME